MQRSDDSSIFCVISSLAYFMMLELCLNRYIESFYCYFDKSDVVIKMIKDSNFNTFCTGSSKLF